MSESDKTYTYRCGEKVELEKSSDQMVVRALSENLHDSAIVTSEQVSSASTRTEARRFYMSQAFREKETKLTNQGNKFGMR